MATSGTTASPARPSALRIPDVDPALVARACAGDAAALDALLRAIQPGVHNLAVRMLGHHDDAADASQEILIRVATHLGGFRGDAAFSTWVWRIARNHLLTAATRVRESPERSLDELRERLDAGLGHARALHGGALDAPAPGTLSPLDRAEAHDVALHCTQAMLMCLDRPHRLAYVIDVIFGLTSEQAAAVLELTPAAYRKRLSRARARLHAFMGDTCALANPAAPCRCDAQLPAVRHARRVAPPAGDAPVLPVRAAPRSDATVAEAARRYDELRRMHDAAGVFRAHPEWAAPERLTTAVRGVLAAAGWLGE